MELIERYLQAVQEALPAAQHDDIVKELRENILAQVEEKEAELGRPLTEDEQAQLLKQYGHPMLLASRYRKQQQLIGPAVFPIYWKVLKLALGVAFLVQAVAGIALAAAGKPLLESLSVLLRYPALALTVFAWVTIIFAVADFFQARFDFQCHWDPRKLPPLHKGGQKKRQYESIAGIVAQAFFGTWWLVGLHYPFWIFGPGAFFYTWGPVWRTLYPVFVVLVLLELGQRSVNLVRPDWTRFRTAARIAIRVLGLGVLGVLLYGGSLFVAADPAAAGAGLQQSVDFINRAVHLALMVAAVVIILNLVREVVSLVGRKIGNAANAAVGG